MFEPKFQVTALWLFGAPLLAAQPSTQPQAAINNQYVVTQASCLDAHPLVVTKLIPRELKPGECVHINDAPVGATIQLQMPGTPNSCEWKVVSSAGVKPIAPPPPPPKPLPNPLPDPGRIAGTEVLYFFNFEITSAAPGSIGMQVFARPASALQCPSQDAPPGVFTFPVNTPY